MKKSERENWQREMFALIKNWQDSGINQRDFCKRHDITIYTFHYWLRKYKQEYSSSEKGFIPVEISPAETISQEDIRIQYPNGVQLILGNSVSISRIKALIKMI